MTYRPVLVKQFDGSTFAGANCGPATSATHLDRDTRGGYTTTGARVRNLTGDTLGGTNLWEDDEALSKGWPTRDHMDVRSRMDWDESMEHVDRGQGESVSLSYLPISGTDFDGSPGFTGNHRMFVNERRVSGTTKQLLVFDPLADARRAGIPRGPMWMPESLVKEAAGLLMLDPETHHRLGFGDVQLGFTRDTEPDYKVVVTAGTFWRYFLDAAGHITHHDSARTGGFSALCSAPAMHEWATVAARNRYNARSLVRLTTGSRQGWYVQPGGSHVTLRRI